MSSIFFKKINYLIIIFLGGSFVKFHTVATKNKKKVPSNRVQRICFWERKGQSHHISRKKKSLKEPYCDNRFLKNNIK